MVNDFVSAVDDVRRDIRDFLVSPQRWRTSRVTTPLAWTSVKFEPGNRDQVPAARGIYAFTVMHANDYFPPHGFIMYIGIAGARAQERTLHDRFYEYVREQQRFKRPRVHYMLTKYKDDLYFNYATVTDERLDLEQLELDLNDAIVPPVVVKDFTAEIRAIVAAFRG